MKDFIYDGAVKIIYGTKQCAYVVQEIAKMGKKVLVVPDPSFVAAGKMTELESKLSGAGITSIQLENIKGPLVSKVREGITLSREEKIEAVIGIGGGVCMDLAKSIAFGNVNDETLLEKYLTYELSTEGLPHLPIITIPTNPMSGSETNADVQLTLDESGLQVGCMFGHAAFTWLNPEYVMSLPKQVLAYGQMTAFVQISCNYMNLTRGTLAEHYAEATMKTILACLRQSFADPTDLDARGNLMISSALSLSGINDLGRDFDFVPYPLQSFAQRYLGLNYPKAITGIFPYWMKEIYRASEDKGIFKRYFAEILNLSVEKKQDEALLQEALFAICNIYKEFGIATSYGELIENPNNREELIEIIESFGPMQSQFMPVPSEKLADIIEAAIIGNFN